MRQFDIPTYYRSSITGLVKKSRKKDDPKKKDFSPAVIDFGAVRFYIARHFGFCFGVENAIEKSYKAIEENPDKRIFLLSQMIHNPGVNQDLQEKGVQFIQDTKGNQLIEWNDITENDIVIIPAFGTTVEIEKILDQKNIDVKKYNTTCPFVEKVWKRSNFLGSKNYTVIIHGKHQHEETRATFSHSKEDAKSIVLKDIHEAQILGDIILGKRPITDFEVYFRNKCSKEFDPIEDLKQVGVVNQTTMLASETQEIADFFKKTMLQKHSQEDIKNYFADTRDTLCYATNDNQQATYALLEEEADLAIVVGGYNSSNTSHIVELCERKFKTFFIESEKEIDMGKNSIHHFNYQDKKMMNTPTFIPLKTEPINIILTSGASCPDTAVDAVLLKILSYFENVKSIDEALEEFKEE